MNKDQLEDKIEELECRLRKLRIHDECSDYIWQLLTTASVAISVYEHDEAEHLVSEAEKYLESKLEANKKKDNECDITVYLCIDIGQFPCNVDYDTIKEYLKQSHNSIEEYTVTDIARRKIP